MDWIYENYYTPTSLCLLLVLWNLDTKEREDEVQVVTSNNKPFLENASVVDICIYDLILGPIKFLDKYGMLKTITFLNFMKTSSLELSYILKMSFPSGYKKVIYYRKNRWMRHLRRLRL